jgi:hypothetical protein
MCAPLATVYDGSRTATVLPQMERAMAKNRKNKGKPGGSSNRRDEDDRTQRSQGTTDRAREGEQREESGRGGSGSMEGGSRSEGKKKGTER